MDKYEYICHLVDELATLVQHRRGMRICVFNEESYRASRDKLRYIVEKEARPFVNKKMTLSVAEVTDQKSLDNCVSAFQR